jgi:hypothetical protein
MGKPWRPQHQGSPGFAAQTVPEINPSLVRFTSKGTRWATASGPRGCTPYGTHSNKVAANPLRQES